MVMSMSPLTALAVYSIAMVSLPILTYFVSHYLYLMFLTAQTANIYAAISSVVVVHIILFMFVYRAYQEDKHITKERITLKSDDKKD